MCRGFEDRVRCEGSGEMGHTVSGNGAMKEAIGREANEGKGKWQRPMSMA